MRVRELPPAYRFAAFLLRRPLMAATARTWRGTEHLPREGGFVVAANHAHELDPLYLAHFMYDAGREAYFLGKKEVFDVPGVGRILRAAGMIPVHRNTPRAADAFREGLDAVREGKAVAIYPEGTLTHDPDGWPMTGKTGAARVALETGAPVVPVAMWLPGHTLRAQRRAIRASQPDARPRRYAGRRRLRRLDVQVLAGPPIDLSDLAGHPLERPVLEEATRRIMAAVTDLVAQLRGEPVPELVHDARTGRKVPR